MNSPNPSTQIRNPLVGTGSEGDRIYQALLERRYIMLDLQNIRLRAALELATGQPWDSINALDMSNDQLENVIADNMVQGLNITKMEALKRVRENKITANPDIT